MTARYAIYYAPPPTHPLTLLASAWLGYDAWTGADVARPALDGLALDADAQAALIADPRHYGFHATLKAPFELAETQTEAALIAAFDYFAATQTGFAAELAVTGLSGFIALTLAQPCPAMTALHSACVRAFEPYRAPLSDADLARRRRSPMTAEQDARLVAYGYPWIFEDFRFHMTLTGRVRDDATRAHIIGALSAYLAPVTGPHAISQLCLFRQPQRDAAFQIIAAAGFNSAA
jgi:putative phosphonate metabolism protein